MIESTPGHPFGGDVGAFSVVHKNMLLRRELIRRKLRENEYVVSITSFPHLGRGSFTSPPHQACGPVAKSFFIPDDMINKHIRFPTLTQNIRERRGRKVAMNIPVFEDEKTGDVDNEGYRCPVQDGDDGSISNKHVYLDAMAFGMGTSCLQVTFQASQIEEATLMHDMLTPLTPLLLALTAATPIYRGYLVDTDARWNQISSSVDDRTPEELGETESVSPGHYRIPKSRYASVSRYLSNGPDFKSAYNDLDVPMNEAVRKRLLDEGLDEMLAAHYAYLFIRDPLVIFEEKLNVDDATSTDHFENIQSTNWQTMRFKLPPPNSGIGWRVEFRPMEIQLTDFENAAFTVFIVLMTRTILSYGLNFYVPLSRVDENMTRAHVRDAVNTQKFFFRKDVNKRRKPCCGDDCDESCHSSDEERAACEQARAEEAQCAGSAGEYTLGEIFNGRKATACDPGFAGLVPLCRAYLKTISPDLESYRTIDRYLKFVSLKASGEIPTNATWIRNFVQSHPAYQKDSVVSQEIDTDLLRAAVDLGYGTRTDETLTGGLDSGTSSGFGRDRSASYGFST